MPTYIVINYFELNFESKHLLAYRYYYYYLQFGKESQNYHFQFDLVLDHNKGELVGPIH